MLPEIQAKLFYGYHAYRITVLLSLFSPFLLCPFICKYRVSTVYNRHATEVQNVLEVHFVSGIIWHDLIKTTTSVLCYYLGPELSLHLNFLAVQRALCFGWVWSDISQLIYLAMKIKWRWGMAWTQALSCQAVWMGAFQFYLTCSRTRKTLPFGVMPLNYTYWNLQ